MARSRATGYAGVDLARFLCALLVIGIHVYPFGNTGDAVLSELNFLTQVWLGRLSVPFFFLCSGFFLFRGSDFRPDKVRTYLKKLLRLYLLWTVLYLPLIFSQIILVHPQGPGAGLLRVIRDLFLRGSYHHLWYLHGALVAVAIVGFLREKGISFGKMLPFALVLFLAGLPTQTYFGILMRLRERLPFVWMIWEIYEQLFVTVRNGVFEGFLYVALGAWLGESGFRLSSGKALAGFLTSMALALAELLVSRHLRWMREYDLFFFQIPAAFFLFCLASQLKLKESTCWPHLRSLANITYFTHVWVYTLLAWIFPVLGWDITTPGLHFLTTATATLLLAEVLLQLQKKPGLSFLRQLFG